MNGVSKNCWSKSLEYSKRLIVEFASYCENFSRERTVCNTHLRSVAKKAINVQDQA